MKQTNKKWLLLAAGDGETRWLRDHSRYRRDAQLKGDRCHVDGTLNLTDNISTDFDTNGYLLLPSHLLDSLRSYTVLFSATPDELDRLQRFYDFGNGSANSLFLRAGTFAAGCKFGGKTATLIRAKKESSSSIIRNGYAEKHSHWCPRLSGMYLFGFVSGHRP